MKRRSRAYILLVDDDERMRSTVGEMIRRLGYSAIECSTAENALGLFASAPKFDVVIVDEIMPGMRGTELTKRLLQVKDDIPVILVTERASPDDISPNGAKALLRKPLLKDHLKGVLEDILKHEEMGKT